MWRAPISGAENLTRNARACVRQHSRSSSPVCKIFAVTQRDLEQRGANLISSNDRQSSENPRKNRSLNQKHVALSGSATGDGLC